MYKYSRFFFLNQLNINFSSANLINSYLWLFLKKQLNWQTLIFNCIAANFLSCIGDRKQG